MLVVGAKHELGEEADLVTVLAFRLLLVGKRGAKVLQTLAVLTAVEQHLVHHDEQLARPVGIELAAEVLVGVESHVVLECGFQEVQECAFFGHEQEDGQLLLRMVAYRLVKVEEFAGSTVKMLAQGEFTRNLLQLLSIGVGRERCSGRYGQDYRRRRRNPCCRRVGRRDCLHNDRSGCGCGCGRRRGNNPSCCWILYCACRRHNS